MKILEALKQENMIMSFSEGRRHILTGQVKLNGDVIKDMQTEIEPNDEIQLGKKIQIKVK